MVMLQLALDSYFTDVSKHSGNTVRKIQTRQVSWSLLETCRICTFPTYYVSLHISFDTCKKINIFVVFHALSNPYQQRAPQE